MNAPVVRRLHSLQWLANQSLGRFLTDGMEIIEVAAAQVAIDKKMTAPDFCGDVAKNQSEKIE
jgi:hypothetical protein